ncbi:unnamed protein product [Withania somnifera]
MRKLNILPDSLAFPSLFNSVTQLYVQLGKSIHCNAIQLCLYSDVYTNTALVYMYRISQQPDDTGQLFGEMPDRNVVTWNALITSYTHNRKFSEAIGEVTMVGVLSACSHLGALGQGRWIHDYIVRNRLRVNVYVGTALIDMYAKCGDIDEAEKVFETMGVKNIYTWREAALQTFDRMIVEDFKPDDVTFLGVLCACCHQGFVEEGRKMFSSMTNQFVLQPKIVHYGCVIDLLGLGGFLDEAMEMIHSMKLKPDATIWRTLLEKKRWTEVGEVRELMDRGGIKMISGCSSIEIGNSVYEFKASDPLKTGHDEIHKMLQDMKNQLKLAGYVLETETALYDISEEEKEHNLMYHSEKLALAFGCYNLWICQDCNQFLKLASAIYKRNIVVRDIKRFHHFAGGLCSCKDYW